MIVGLFFSRSDYSLNVFSESKAIVVVVVVVQINLSNGLRFFARCILLMGEQELRLRHKKEDSYISLSALNKALLLDQQFPVPFSVSSWLNLLADVVIGEVFPERCAFDLLLEPELVDKKSEY